MIRWSMITGWWEMLRHPMRRRRDSVDFELMLPGGSSTKHMSLTKPLVSEKAETMEDVPLPIDSPEPGDATKRHETTNMFDFALTDDEDEREKEKKKQNDLDDVV